MAITRRPVRDRSTAIPLSILDLAPWDEEGAPALIHPGEEGVMAAPGPRAAPPAGEAVGVEGGDWSAGIPARRGRGDGGDVAPRPRRTGRTAPANASTSTGAALARAFGALAARAHTVREMDARLGRAGFAPEAVGGAVTRLQDLGYLDDASYAEGWVASRRTYRLHGTLRLRHDLARRGVDDATIAAAIADDGGEVERACAVAARAVPGLARLDRASATRRLAGTLARRGFAAPVVARVVRDALVAHVDGSSPDADGDLDLASPPLP